jgi:hypothetical protein
MYFYVPGSNHIRCITESRWKYAMYYDIYDGTEPEYELYDLENDPYETVNLAFPTVFAGLDPEMQALVEAERQRLHTKLTVAMEKLGTTPDTIIWPKISGLAPATSTDLPRHSPYAETETQTETEATA